MRNPRHNDTGEARRMARGSLVGLLLVTVILGTLLNVLVGLITPNEENRSVALMVVLLATLVCILVSIYLDDRRVGHAEILVEWVQAYQVVGDSQRAEPHTRASFDNCRFTQEAWNARFPQGLALLASKGDFAHQIIREHFELLRYLLFQQLLQYGEEATPDRAIHGWLRLKGIATQRLPYKAWPKSIRRNEFMQAKKRNRQQIEERRARQQPEKHARQQVAHLPAGVRIEFYAPPEIARQRVDSRWHKRPHPATPPRRPANGPDRKTVWRLANLKQQRRRGRRWPTGLIPKKSEDRPLVRITWQLINVPFLEKFPWLTNKLPGGELLIRWLGPLDEVHPDDKRAEEVTTRLAQTAKEVTTRPPDHKIHVIATRLMIEVNTRWNFMSQVGLFYDWSLNLGYYLAKRMDIREWWQYAQQRTLMDMDWKIGYIAKHKDEPSLAARLAQLEEHLARIEAKLPPPPA